MSDNIDLSRMTPDAVNSEVLKKTITHPLTIFPFLGGMLFLAFWGIFDASLIFMGLGVGSAVFGGSMFPINRYARYESFRKAYFKELREENERIAQEKLKNIIAFLDERNFDQAARQVDKIQESMKSFERVLNRKFEPYEFAYARYHGIAEQVTNLTLANLEQIVTMLEAIDSIDPDYIENRIKEIGKKSKGDEKNLTASQKEELATLEERWNIREKSFEDIDALLLKNEKALTELEKIATNIATSNVTGVSTEAELTTAMNSLNSLGEEARKNWG